MERKYEDSSSLIQVSFWTMTLHIFLEYSPGKPIFVCGVGESASKKWPQVIQGPSAELKSSCRVPWTLLPAVIRLLNRIGSQSFESCS